MYSKMPTEFFFKALDGQLLMKICTHSRESCADTESFIRGDGPTLTSFFLVDEERAWRGDPNTTKSGSSSARQRNTNDGPTLNAGLLAL